MCPDTTHAYVYLSILIVKSKNFLRFSLSPPLFLSLFLLWFLELQIFVNTTPLMSPATQVHSCRDAHVGDIRIRFHANANPIRFHPYPSHVLSLWLLSTSAGDDSENKPCRRADWQRRVWFRFWWGWAEQKQADSAKRRGITPAADTSRCPWLLLWRHCPVAYRRPPQPVGTDYASARESPPSPRSIHAWGLRWTFF